MEDTRIYTGLFIIDPEKEGSIDDVKGDIASIIKDNSGTVESENVIGKRTLAYAVKKKTEGIYCEITFSASPEVLKKMSRQFEINNDILRTLISKKG